jgi:hypothetical protein
LTALPVVVTGSPTPMKLAHLTLVINVVMALNPVTRRLMMKLFKLIFEGMFWEYVWCGVFTVAITLALSYIYFYAKGWL